MNTTAIHIDAKTALDYTKKYNWDTLSSQKINNVEDIINIIFIDIYDSIEKGYTYTTYDHYGNIPDEVAEYFKSLGYDVWYDSMYKDDPDMCKSIMYIEWGKK